VNGPTPRVFWIIIASLVGWLLIITLLLLLTYCAEIA